MRGDSRGDPASTYACGGSCGVLRPLLPAGVEPVSETLRGEAPRTLLLRGMLGGVQAGPARPAVGVARQLRMSPPTASEACTARPARCSLSCFALSRRAPPATARTPSVGTAAAVCRVRRGEKWSLQLFKALPESVTLVDD